MAEIKWRKLTEIHLNPTNPRTIKDSNFERLVQSIKEFPEMLEIRPLVLDANSMVLGGNMRLRACRKAGLTSVPTISAADLTAEQQKEFIIKDNVGYGDWDFDQLANDWNVEQLTAWGLDVPDFGDKANGGKDDGYVPPDHVDTDIQPGDLLEIGPHRLLCGDSTDPKDVARLMDGQKAAMVFTDPPYGVNVQGGTGKGTLIEGDLTQTAIPFAFEQAVTLATADRAHFYFCAGEGNTSLYHKLFDRYLHSLPRALIWVKEMFVMKHHGYHNQYELIFYGFKTGAGHLWYGGRTEDEASDVWQVRRDNSNSYLHPTQKPVELPARAMRNSSQRGDIVFEPFAGSGSTMVAADQLGRRCFALEITPHYCQTIVDRMLAQDPSLIVTRNGNRLDQKLPDLSDLI